MRQPREHREVASVAAVDHRGVVVIAQHGHRAGTGLDAADGGQQQGRQLRVTQRVGAHGEALVVIEQAQRGLLAWAQEVLLVGHPPHPGHEVGLATVDTSDHVEQAGTARPQLLRPHDVDDTARRDLALSQPRLGERPQSQVALRRHSWTGLSSGARSNHKKP